MKRNLQISLDHVLRDEGTALRDGRGEPRRYGLQLNDLCRLCGTAQPSDLKELDLAHAREFLAASHWAWGRCSLLEDGLDYFFFDTSVHCGWQTAARWLRELVGMPGLEVDEWVVDRANRMAETAIGGLEFYRRRRYKVDPLWLQLGAEWTNRCNRAKTRAAKIALGEHLGEVLKGTQHAQSL